MEAMMRSSGHRMHGGQGTRLDDIPEGGRQLTQGIRMDARDESVHSSKRKHTSRPSRTPVQEGQSRKSRCRPGAGSRR